MRRFWPPSEAAQADYEVLRQAVLDGRPLISQSAARFENQGLWGLISKPLAQPVFSARLIGAKRPAWSPYNDPRLEALADAFQYLLNVIDASTEATGS